MAQQTVARRSAGASRSLSPAQAASAILRAPVQPKASPAVSPTGSMPRRASPQGSLSPGAPPRPVSPRPAEAWTAEKRLLQHLPAALGRCSVTLQLRTAEYPPEVLSKRAPDRTALERT